MEVLVILTANNISKYSLNSMHFQEFKLIFLNQENLPLHLSIINDIAQECLN